MKSWQDTLIDGAGRRATFRLANRSAKPKPQGALLQTDTPKSNRRHVKTERCGPYRETVIPFLERHGGRCASRLPRSGSANELQLPSNGRMPGRRGGVMMGGRAFRRRALYKGRSDTLCTSCAWPVSSVDSKVTSMRVSEIQQPHNQWCPSSRPVAWIFDGDSKAVVRRPRQANRRALRHRFRMWLNRYDDRSHCAVRLLMSLLGAAAAPFSRAALIGVCCRSFGNERLVEWSSPSYCGRVLAEELVLLALIGSSSMDACLSLNERAVGLMRVRRTYRAMIPIRR